MPNPRLRRRRLLLLMRPMFLLPAMLAPALLVPALPGAAVPTGSAAAERSRALATHYLNAAVTVVQRCGQNAGQDALMAGRAAKLLEAGGGLRICGDPGLVAEATGRAGGLMMMQPLSPPARPAPGSVVIFGWKDPADLEGDREWLQQIRASGSFVVGIGCDTPPVAVRGRFDGALISTGVGPQVMLKGRGYCPLDSIANAVNLWCFTGELIAALSRDHRTATVWESIWVPGAAAHNTPRLGRPFDPTLTIAPIPARWLAREYVRFLLRSITGMESDLPRFEAAARELAAARASGHHDRMYVMAHMVDAEIGGRDDPGYLEMLQDPFRSEQIQPGDALFGLGYVGIPADVAEAVAAQNLRSTWFVAPLGGPLEHSPAVRLIDARWRLGDTAVALPGYDVGALPPSGVLQLAAYWTLNAAMLPLAPPAREHT